MIAPIAHRNPEDIDPEAALLRLAADQPPVILDLRLSEDRANLPKTLPGALTVDHGDLEKQLRLCGDRPVMAFCHKGLKLTHGAAARLAASGIEVMRLKGGIMAWQDVGHPLYEIEDRPQRVVVPNRCELSDLPEIWAALRFAIPSAEVIEVAPEHVADVARTFDARNVSALPKPDVPRWAMFCSLAASPSIAAQVNGVEGRPGAALPLLDALYRGIMA